MPARASSDLGELHGFRLVGTLYYGERTVIYEALDADGQTFALKRAVGGPGGKARLAQLEREHEVSLAVCHPALRRCLGRFAVPKRGKPRELTLQLELVPGPSLADVAPAAEELPALLAPIAAGLQALHAAGYVHGDVKPANILRDQHPRARLIDFGISGPIGAAPPHVQGSAITLAPEQLARAPRTPATDVFALAATLAALCPADLINQPDLLDACRHPDPRRRPPLSELAAALGR